MFRALLRAILILVVLVVVVVAAATFFFGYRIGGGEPAIDRDITGTSGQIEPVKPLDQSDKDRGGTFDTAKARERGGQIGEKVAEAGNKAAAFMSDAALTAKIKSKMSLDDHVKASDIHVSTDAHVVTLTGTARSEDEHRRALDLARDTEGVRRVIDRIKVRR